MITVKIYQERKYLRSWYITKICLFGFLPIFIKKVEVS